MSQLPKVIRQYAQPKSGGGVKAEKAVRKQIKEALLPAAQMTSAQEIGFFAHTLSGVHENFTAFAGEGAPTVTEGWAKIAKVPRFQRVAITVPEGYEPIVMTVPILFDAVRLTKDRPDIEEDIRALEWMAGREPLQKGNETKGEPPFVMVYSTDSKGKITNLIPKNYQTVPGRSQQWYVTNIAFDANPLREGEAGPSKGNVPVGDRIRQAATVTLTEVVSTPSALARNRASRESVQGKYVKVRSDSAVNTIKKIATREGIPGSWQAILKANRNLGTSAEKVLPKNTVVKIPLTAFRQVPR